MRQLRFITTFYISKGYLRICNGCVSKFYKSNDWRKSLVPAPAVIPAPIVYSKIVAVKTLVVEPSLLE